MIYALLEPCTSPKPFVHLVSDPFILAYTIRIFTTVLFQIINVRNLNEYGVGCSLIGGRMPGASLLPFQVA